MNSSSIAHTLRTVESKVNRENCYWCFSPQHIPEKIKEKEQNVMKFVRLLAKKYQQGMEILIPQFPRSSVRKNKSKEKFIKNNVLEW